jgi:hypothetical protein
MDHGSTGSQSQSKGPKKISLKGQTKEVLRPVIQQMDDEGEQEFEQEQRLSPIKNINSNFKIQNGSKKEQKSIQLPQTDSEEEEQKIKDGQALEGSPKKYQKVSNPEEPVS